MKVMSGAPGSAPARTDATALPLKEAIHARQFGEGS